MKTSELTGAELDAWVARAEGYKARTDDECDWWDADDGGFVRQKEWEPSTDWAQGGPIIERERININERDGDCWGAFYSGKWTKFGPTPLIAAMRTFVASKYGDTVPDEA